MWIGNYLVLILASLRCSMPQLDDKMHAIVKSRLDAMNLIHKANKYLDENNHKDALTAYLSVLESQQLNEHRHIILYNMATTLIALNLNGKARESLEEVLKLVPKSDPKRQDVLVKLAEVCSRLGDWNAASDFFGKAFESGLQDPTTMKNYASALMNTNNVSNSIKAADILSFAYLQTQEIRFRCERGIALIAAKVYKEASLELKFCRDTTPSDINLHADLGLRIGEKSINQSIAHFELFVRDGQAWKNAAPQFKNAVLYRLGRAYRSQQRLEEESQLYERAVDLGIIFNIQQRPGYFHRKFVDPKKYAQIPAPQFYPVGAGRMDYVSQPSWGHVAQLIRRLEASASAIRAEFVRHTRGIITDGSDIHTPDEVSSKGLSGVEMDMEGTISSLGKTASLSQSNELLRVTSDAEGIVVRGDWKQIPLIRDGKPIAGQRIAGMESTMAILREVLGDKLLSLDLPLGAMEISVLSANSHLQAHCGPTNHKIRLHLGLIIPQMNNESANSSTDATASMNSTAGAVTLSKVPHIRVANEAHLWEEGKVLLFDDSYEHEVFNPTPHPRVVLLLDIWHPDISLKERKRIRKNFSYTSS